MVGKASKNTTFFILLVLICTIIGSFFGDILSPYLPKLLVQGFKVSAGPFPVDLKVLNFTFGVTINMNFMSVLGLIIALIIYKKG